MILIFYFLIITTGCGNIKSEKQVLKYATKENGAVKLIDKKIISEEKVTYTLKDKKYDFLYECTSFVNDFNMDGSTFFTYPTIECTFDTNYKQYIYNLIKADGLILNNNFTIDLPESISKKYIEFEIYTPTLNQEKIYKDLIKKIEKIDNRKYFKKITLQIYDKNSKDKIRIITSKNDKLLTSVEEHDQWFLEYANKMFSSQGNSDSKEIKFVKKEEDILIKDREEIYDKLLQRIDTQHENDLETAKTTIYYFYDSIAKHNFYIIDYYVMGQACYFNNYAAKVRNEHTELYLNGCQW